MLEASTTFQTYGKATSLGKCCSLCAFFHVFQKLILNGAGIVYLLLLKTLPTLGGKHTELCGSICTHAQAQWKRIVDPTEIETPSINNAASFVGEAISSRKMSTLKMVGPRIHRLLRGSPLVSLFVYSRSWVMFCMLCRGLCPTTDKFCAMLSSTGTVFEKWT